MVVIAVEPCTPNLMPAALVNLSTCLDNGAFDASSDFLKNTKILKESHLKPRLAKVILSL